MSLNIGLSSPNLSHRAVLWSLILGIPQRILIFFIFALHEKRGKGKGKFWFPSKHVLGSSISFENRHASKLWFIFIQMKIVCIAVCEEVTPVIGSAEDYAEPVSPTNFINLRHKYQDLSAAKFCRMLFPWLQTVCLTNISTGVRFMLL